MRPTIEPANVATLRDELAAILSGLVAGGRYGLKIRTPHALGEQRNLRDIISAIRTPPLNN